MIEWGNANRTSLATHARRGPCTASAPEDDDVDDDLAKETLVDYFHGAG